jgi:hypothetical protein
VHIKLWQAGWDCGHGVVDQEQHHALILFVFALCGPQDARWPPLPAWNLCGGHLLVIQQSWRVAGKAELW